MRQRLVFWTKRGCCVRFLSKIVLLFRKSCNFATKSINYINMNIKLTICNLCARAAMLLLATVISMSAWAEDLPDIPEIDNYQYYIPKAIIEIPDQILIGNSVNINYSVKAHIYSEEKDYGLVKDKDYTAEIKKGNITVTEPISDVGEYTLTITGIAPYFGSQEKQFKVIKFTSGDGSLNAPFAITNNIELDLLAGAVNSGQDFSKKYFKLTKDISYSYISNWDNTDSDENNYNSIGCFYETYIDYKDEYEGHDVTATIIHDYKFNGIFDGDGHTIKGIRVNITGDNGYVGLFGRLGKGAVVKNLTLDDANITGPQYTGGIAGMNYGGKITNCHVTSNVTIHADDATYNSWHGGIAGQNGGNDVNGEISYCTSAAKLTIKSGITSWDYYGGIVGQNKSGSTLDHNLVIGAVLPIPTNNDNDKKCGAITGSNDPGKTSGILVYNYYDGCTLGNSGVGIGDNSRSDATDQAEPATILTDTKGLSLQTSLSGKVVYFRAFRYGEPSTIILPFVPIPTENVDQFYTFKGVEKDGNYYKAIMEESTSLNYNTPYIYKAVKPNNETESFRLAFYVNNFESSTSIVEVGSTTPTEDTHWTFKGSYSEILWGALSPGQKRNEYGFAGQAVSDTEDSSKSIEAGEFVRIGEYVRLRPQRCYMEYTPTSSTRAGSLTDEELPETIRVILVDDGGKTDIGSLSPKTGIITFDSDAWYSLDGKRLSTQPNQKGIYVNNGKKVVIK